MVWSFFVFFQLHKPHKNRAQQAHKKKQRSFFPCTGRLACSHKMTSTPLPVSTLADEFLADLDDDDFTEIKKEKEEEVKEEEEDEDHMELENVNAQHARDITKLWNSDRLKDLVQVRTAFSLMCFAAHLYNCILTSITHTHHTHTRTRELITTCTQSLLQRLSFLLSSNRELLLQLQTRTRQCTWDLSKKIQTTNLWWSQMLQQQRLV